MNRKTTVILAFLFLCGLSIQNVHGAMVKLSLEQLVADADLIIVGTVDSVHSELKDGKIVSFATVSVRLIIKGELGATCDNIIVRYPGGVVGGVSMKAEDSPDYKQGEEVVIFLKKIENQLEYRTIGSSQGKLLIKKKMVVRENISVGEFLEKIKKIVHPTQ